MKLTLDIDDAHAPALIQLLATLLAKSSPVEGIEDPAPGHPELPLQDTDEEDFRWCIAGELDETADPTLRDLPMGSDFPTLPPLPEGKTRWVNRGAFEVFEVNQEPRLHVKYWDEVDWVNTRYFSGKYTHIQAI